MESTGAGRVRHSEMEIKKKKKKKKKKLKKNNNHFCCVFFLPRMYLAIFIYALIFCIVLHGVIRNLLNIVSSKVSRQQECVRV